MRDLFLSIRRIFADRVQPTEKLPSADKGAHSEHRGETARCVSCGVELDFRCGVTAKNGLPGMPGLECELCAAYGWVGEKDPLGRGRDMVAHSLVALLPELSASDVNLLHWAIAVALENPSERERAAQVAQRLQARLHDTKHGYGSMRTSAFGEAMGFLSDGEYAMRDVAELRLVFAPELLRALSQAVGSVDARVSECAGWHSLTEATRKRMVTGADSTAAGVPE